LLLAGLLLLALGAGYSFLKGTESSLKDAFAPKFLIGGALNDAVVSGDDPKAAEIVLRHYNSITPENVMKWEHIHPGPGKFSFVAADRLVDFGMKHNMVVIGHTLVWHSQIPDWAFLDAAGQPAGRDTMLARMREHITAVVGRYKGTVRGWDVVNEAFEDDGTFVKSGWLKAIGEDYIAKAFEYAHDADQGAELYYNDFSLDKPAKRDAVVRLVRDLKKRGLRVDAVGIQGHWGMDYPTKADFDAFADSVKATGLKLMVTELDVDILPAAWNYTGADVNARVELQKELNPYPAGLPGEKQQELARRYGELFSMILDHAENIQRVTFWGVYDKTSWLNNWPVRGRTSYPLLFDRNYQPKPAFDAVIKSVQGKK